MKWAFVYMLATVNLVSLIHLGFFVVGANTYDILKFRKTARAKAATPVVPEQPLISIIVPAHNESVVIRRTLDSIRASSYKNIEVIVVDDGSTDNTYEIVQSYVRQLPWTKTQSRFIYESTDEKEFGPRSTAAERYRRRFIATREFARTNSMPTRIIRVVQMNAGKAAAMNNAITNFVHGSLIMCLDADSILHPKAIERAVAYFVDPKIIGVAANVRVMAGQSWLSKLQRFEHMIGYRSKKFYTMTNSEFIVGGVASTYRTDIVKKVNLYDTDTMTEDIGLSMKMVALEGNKGSRIVYASDVVAMTEGVQTYKALIRQRYRWKMGSLQNMFKYRALFLNRDKTKYSRMLTRYRLPMALFGELLLVMEPLVLAYIVYLSIMYHTLGIIVGAYITVTLYTLWTIWPDEHFTNKQKINLSFSSLGIYVIFYAMDVVQIAAIMRCLWNFRSIARRNSATTWVSPARQGDAVSVSFTT
jgi:biofilm PGA synthesis N-glycosyltransferase PgaC